MYMYAYMYVYMYVTMYVYIYIYIYIYTVAGRSTGFLRHLREKRARLTVAPLRRRRPQQPAVGAGGVTANIYRWYIMLYNII